MLRWYPPAWRERYSGEMTALLEDTHGGGRVPLTRRIALARAGAVERARAAGVVGNSTGPYERVRAGSHLILCAWALFMIGGAIFAKFSEHWDAAVPRPHQWRPNDGYLAVQISGFVGVALIAVAALVVLPALLRHIREHGTGAIRRPITQALIAGGLAVGLLAGVAVWAHHLSGHSRNGGFWPFAVVGGVLGLAIIAAIAMSTAAAVRVTRRLDVSPRAMKTLGGMSLALTLVMAAIMAGTLIWWQAVAQYSPQFLGGGLFGYSNVLPVPLLGAAALMLIGLVLAAAGTMRVARELRGDLRGT
jgi:hypothetical protein